MVNLGFSGNAKGEPEMAELISQLEMSALVMDYDHNAPDAEHLKKTHENFFKIIRNKQPDLPIIIVTKPDFDRDIETNKMRREIIYNTYKNAVDNGDQNVHFVDGETLFGNENRDACTVDGCHPNDLGFMRMAERIYPVIKKALGSLAPKARYI
jgi:lysophospholipase L1-like esterase